MGQIPNFCATCGARLEAHERKHCSRWQCQKLARARAIRIATDGAPGSISKEAMLSRLDSDLASRSSASEQSKELSLLRALVAKHPWDDCSSFLAKREVILSAPAPAPYREPIPPSEECAPTPILRDPHADARRELSEQTAESVAEDLKGFGEWRKAPLHPPSSLRDLAPRMRDVMIGFGPITIAGDSTQLLTSMPQMVLRGKRLLIPSAIANNFLINDLRIGRISQFASAAAIPAACFSAACFSELAVGVAFGTDTCVPGIMITLSISNITACPQTFYGSLMCETPVE